MSSSVTSQYQGYLPSLVITLRHIWQHLSFADHYERPFTRPVPHQKSGSRYRWYEYGSRAQHRGFYRFLQQYGGISCHDSQTGQGSTIQQRIYQKEYLQADLGSKTWRRHFPRFSLFSGSAVSITWTELLSIVDFYAASCPTGFIKHYPFSISLLPYL